MEARYILVFRIFVLHQKIHLLSPAQVGNYLRLFRGALYKKFPGLARRNLTNDERRKLIDMGHSQVGLRHQGIAMTPMLKIVTSRLQHVTSSTISLLLAREVEDLLAGRLILDYKHLSKLLAGSQTSKQF